MRLCEHCEYCYKGSTINGEELFCDNPLLYKLSFDCEELRANNELCGSVGKYWKSKSNCLVAEIIEKRNKAYEQII